MTGDSVSRYSFDAQAGAEYVVFLEAVEGIVQVYVIDSTHQHTVAFVSAAPGSPPLYSNPTANFQTTEGGVYLLRVFAFPSGAAARFRFVVSRINTDPEKVPMRFAVGDTVLGETIEPMVDGDEFLAAGDAGQEFVVVLQVPGPAGSGAVGLVVIDPATDDLFGIAAANAGSASPVTTGRIRFPGSHDYRFIVRSIVSNAYPRYSGPYRFWSYLINRAPEHRNAAVPLDTEIRGEGIDQAGDVDEFTFNAPAGAQYNVFLQAPRAFQLEVAPLTGLPVAAVAAEPTDTALFAHATGRFQTAQAGTYVVRVMGSAPNDVADTGAYRLFIYAIDPRPEHVPASLTPGDSAEGESIDRPGDVDEFTFSGTAGQEFNAFLQGGNGSTATTLQLSVIDAVGTVQRIAQSTGADTSLLDQVTGRFALASAGTYRLRVTGAQSLNDRDTGAYRLLLYQVDRRPESVPVTLTLGDSSSGEGIDVPGDVDEYRVVVQDTSGFNLVAMLDDQPREGTPVIVQLLDAGGTQVTGLFANTVPAEAGRIRIVPGTYTLRVDVTHWQDKPTFRGTYRLWLYRFAYAPELVSDTVAIGDTVSGEVIHPWGDVDQFHFYGLRGQHINIALQGRADASGGAFQAWISGPGGEPMWTFASVSSAASAPTLREHQTMRLDLPVTGWYHVEMTGFGPTRGAYRLFIEPLSASPEQAGSALVPGDSVTTESIDTPGDWDEFTLTATPGQDLNVIFQGDPAMNGYAQIRVYDRVSGDSLAGNVGQGKRVVGPFRVPVSGQVTIAVFQEAYFVRFCYDATCAGVFGLVGPYAFRVDPLNRGPETAPAAVTVGDTVRGEELTPIGDLDEFTTSATPGVNLSLNARLLANPVPAGGIVWLDVLDPATGTVLSSGSGLIAGSPTSPFYSLASVVVPASGSVLFRFRGYGNWGDDPVTAPYEFFVQR